MNKMIIAIFGIAIIGVANAVIPCGAGAGLGTSGTAVPCIFGQCIESKEAECTSTQECGAGVVATCRLCNTEKTGCYSCKTTEYLIPPTSATALLVAPVSTSNIVGYTCGTTCPVGRYAVDAVSGALPKVCQPCPANCDACTSNTVCTQCKNTFYLKADNTCVDAATCIAITSPSQLYKREATTGAGAMVAGCVTGDKCGAVMGPDTATKACAACLAANTCDKCDTDIKQCSACKTTGTTGTTLKNNGTTAAPVNICVNPGACGEGYFEVTASTRCWKCHPSCKTCTIAADSDGTTLADKCNTCANMFGKPDAAVLDTATTKCEACAITGCKTCAADKAKCTVCADGNFLNTTATPNTCTACDATCATCNADGCLTCKNATATPDATTKKCSALKTGAGLTLAAVFSVALFSLLF